MSRNTFYKDPTPTMSATGSFVVTPADSAFAAGAIIRAVTINVSGTIRWLDAAGVTQDTSTLPAGTYSILAYGIYAAGTTATGITGWY